MSLLHNTNITNANTNTNKNIQIIQNMGFQTPLRDESPPWGAKTGPFEMQNSRSTKRLLYYSQFRLQSNLVGGLP